jgi:flagellar biosynthesis/type III secretory pathway protein FliH
MRPYQPPSLLALISDEDGTTAARMLSDERIRSAAFATGRQQGLEEGQRMGREEGVAAARAEAERGLQAELERRGQRGAAACAAALEVLLSRREADRRALDADLRAALAGALEAVFPALLARAAGGEVLAMVNAALDERAQEVLTLRAHPDTLSAAGADGLAVPERLRLRPDPALPPGQAEVAWGEGGLLYDPAALQARVLALLGAPAAPASTTSQEISP